MNVPPVVQAEWEDQLDQQMTRFKRDVIKHVLALPPAQLDKHLPGEHDQDDHGNREMTKEEAKARFAEIKAEIGELMQTTGGALSSDQASQYQELSRESGEILFDFNRPLDPAKVQPPEERQSTLSADLVMTAYEDLKSDRNVYMAIHMAAVGAQFNAETEVDAVMRGESKSVSPEQFYQAFSRTRDALRAEYGDTLHLYRAVGEQREKPTTNWATTREFARNFGNDIVEEDIPVENVIALNVGLNGNYHELIVGDPPSTLSKHLPGEHDQDDHDPTKKKTRRAPAEWWDADAYQQVVNANLKRQFFNSFKEMGVAEEEAERNAEQMASLPPPRAVYRAKVGGGRNATIANYSNVDIPKEHMEDACQRVAMLMRSDAIDDVVSVVVTIKDTTLQEDDDEAVGEAVYGTPTSTIILTPAVFSLSRQRWGWWMDASHDVSPLEYIIAHEYGHVRAKGADQSFTEIERAGVSGYGKTNDREGYAEAYAQWVIDKDGPMNFKKRFAERAKAEGWPDD